MKPDPETKELTVVALHPGITREQVAANAGWPVRFAEPLEQALPPGTQELAVLRDMQERTARGHGTALR
jgi:glutaconate CoA-transferase subunit B